MDSIYVYVCTEQANKVRRYKKRKKQLYKNEGMEEKTHTQYTLVATL